MAYSFCMNEESKFPGNPDEPATKGDLAKLREDTKADFARMATHLQQGLNELKDHFDVVAENIHKDVSEANRDVISLIVDQKIPDHEQRIRVLEDKAGVAAGHLPSV